MEGYIGRWKDIQVDGRIYKWMEGYIGRWKNIQVDGRIYRQMEEYIDRWKDNIAKFSLKNNFPHQRDLLFVSN